VFDQGIKGLIGDEGHILEIQAFETMQGFGSSDDLLGEDRKG